MLPVTLLPAAENDLLEQAEYYDAKGGEALGNRFVAACESGFERLSSFPESGAPLRFPNPRLEGLRFILVPDFENILIFYIPGNTRVRIGACSARQTRYRGNPRKGKGR
jgi:plasmid stabilization system protein ParE